MGLTNKKNQAFNVSGHSFFVPSVLREISSERIVLYYN